jgi:peptidoglycan/xylan/chitin deacetylase (PgdA/CDA1 family)
MIHRTPFPLPLIYPSLLWRMPSDEKVLYLTFDDGPVSGPTEFVLHTLSRFEALGTFFCIGDNIRKYPHVFEKIIQDGHAVGNHTFNHLNGWKTDTQVYLENIMQCSAEISKHGVETALPAFAQSSKEILLGPVASNNQGQLFRPPYGRITRKQIKALADFTIVMWDVLSIDYSHVLSPESVLRNTISASRNGSIIVFHDSFKAEKNMTYTLPRLLEHFAEQGYTFKSIPS